MSNQSQLN